MDNNEQKTFFEDKEKQNQVEIIETAELKKVEKKTPKVVNLFKIGTVNVYHHDKLPAPLKKRYEKLYQGRRHHLWFDFILLLVLIAAIGFNIFFVFSSDTYFSIQLGKFPMLSIVKHSTVGEVDFQISQTIVNKTTDIINLNEEIEINIKTENLSNQAIQNIELVTKVIGSTNYSITLGSLNNEINNINKEEIDNKNLKFKLTNSQNGIITIQTQAIFNWQGEEQIIDSEPIYLKLNSAIDFMALARFYTAEGDQLGLGPLPPEVGKKTSYWVFWPIESGFNDLTETEVSGTLPSNVNYSGKSTVNYGSALQFNSVTRTITWPIGNLEKNKNIQAGFEVEIIPTQIQQGFTPNLLENITVEAVDSLTNQLLTKKVNNITTDLIYDELATGQCFIQ